MKTSDQLYASATLPMRMPILGRLCGPQSCCGRCEEEKNLLPLPEIEARPYTD
jgi:hypothetical protein